MEEKFEHFKLIFEIFLQKQGLNCQFGTFEIELKRSRQDGSESN